ncbi:MAG: hypothetical protein P4M08_05270 [Oligoflexia bacterium]|nr:hypothetical protein [Oligoflexia bacterium]
MKKLQLTALATLTLASPFVGGNAFALDDIIKPYESVRSSGMGGVTLTTGLYDENYFGNPARVTANPTWRVTILDPMVETNSHVSNSVRAVNGGSNIYNALGGDAGDDNHFRLQTTMPSVYIPTGHGRWAFALGFITSSQVDVDLRRSFNIEPTGIVDVGPALTVGRTFMEENDLSVGITARATYRLSTNTAFSFVDLINGQSISPRATGGQGGMADFDLGTTYTFRHFHPGGVDLSVAGAVENVMGGNFNNLKLRFLKDSHDNPTPANRPLPEPRRGGFGFSAQKASMGFLHNTSLALEFQDIGNNTNGSVYRTVHIGGETHFFSIFVLRGGVNQGYLTGGFGLDLRILTIDVSTYGEELSLNPGQLEDRRYALRVALQL